MKFILSVYILLISGMSISFAQTSNWVLNGPNNFPVNISGQINGIGRVCQIKFDPNQNNTLYACSASGGLWKSTDAGNQWTNMQTDKLPEMNLSSLCIDYTNSDIIYLGSGDPNYYSADLGIWKTIDGGTNWTQINNGLGDKMAVELLMDPSDHLALIAATDSGIYKTIDGGNNWIKTLNVPKFTDMAWQPGVTNPVLFASSMNKFFRSTDKGDTWIEITNGLTGQLDQGTRIAVSAANSAVVYLGTIKDEGTIFKSIDSGLSFTITYHDPTRSLTGYDTTGGGQGNYNFCLEANPSNADEIFLGSHNIWRSQDGGTNWSKLTNWWQTVHTDMHDYAFQPGTNNLFQANDGGVWLTSDSGINWTQKSHGLSATENYHAAASPLYNQLLGSGTQDNGELVRIDSIWKTNRGGDWTTAMQMDYSPQKFIYYFDDKKRRSLPSGSSNEYGITTAIPTNSYTQVFSPDNQDIAYAAGTKLWRTNNLTSNSPVWIQIASGTSLIKSIALCKGHPNILAYSTLGKLYVTQNALDLTPTFTLYNLPLNIASQSMYISSLDTSLLFLILNGKVYKTSIGSSIFTDITGNLPNINHLNIFLDDYSNNQSLYVGNPLGVYYLNQNLTNWVNYSGALPTIAPIRDFMWFNDGSVDARMYASYFGRGIWETKIENSSTCTTPSISNSQWVNGSFQVNWNSTGSTSYAIQVREVGTLNWNQSIINSNTYSLGAFSGCTQYEARVRSICGADSSLWSSRIYFQTPSNPLNTQFDGHQDIGPISVAGSVCYDSVHQRYTILAEGEDIWNKNDQFHFLYKKMSGDLTISAKVKHIGNIYGWAKAGVMVRETLADDAKHAICALTPGNGFAMQWREQTNDWTTNKDTAGSAPGWVKLE